MRSLIRINCTLAAAVYQPRHSVARISWWGAFGIYLEVEWLKLWKFTFETREILCHGCVRICDVKCRFSGDFQMIFGEWLYSRIDSQICHQMRIFGTVRGNRLNLLSEYWGFTNLCIFTFQVSSSSLVLLRWQSTRFAINSFKFREYSNRYILVVVGKYPN